MVSVAKLERFSLTSLVEELYKSAITIRILGLFSTAINFKRTSGVRLMNKMIGESVIMKTRKKRMKRKRRMTTKMDDV